MTPALESCPACGSGIKHHSPETETEHEAWEFYCYAIILRVENGQLTVESNCDNVTRSAVAKLNATALSSQDRGTQ